MSLSLLYFRWSDVFLFKGGQTTPQVISVLGWLFETKNFVAAAQLLVLVKQRTTSTTTGEKSSFIMALGKGGVVPSCQVRVHQ